jgi:hypothetical protein
MQNTQTEGQQKKESKRKSQSKSLIGAWVVDSLHGSKVFNVKIETSIQDKDIRQAVASLTESGVPTSDLVVMTVTRERPVGVRKSERIVVTF